MHIEFHLGRMAKYVLDFLFELVLIFSGSLVQVYFNMKLCFERLQHISLP